MFLILKTHCSVEAKREFKKKVVKPSRRHAWWVQTAEAKSKVFIKVTYKICILNIVITSLLVLERICFKNISSTSYFGAQAVTAATAV